MCDQWLSDHKSSVPSMQNAVIIYQFFYIGLCIRASFLCTPRPRWRQMVKYEMLGLAAKYDRVMWGWVCLLLGILYRPMVMVVFCAESSVVVFLSLLCLNSIVLLLYVFVVYLYPRAARCAYSIINKLHRESKKQDTKLLAITAKLHQLSSDFQNFFSLLDSVVNLQQTLFKYSTTL